MDARRTISELCRRYGVPPNFGERLRPLLERAHASSPPTRRRLLLTIKESFEQEARRLQTLMSPRDLPEADWKVVKTVANVLHAWDPPVWLRLWEEARRRRRP